MVGRCSRKAPPDGMTFGSLERTGRLAFLTVDKADGVTAPVAVLLALRGTHK